MKKRIALIYGGEGCEQDISVKSAKWLYSTIDKEFYDVLPIFIEKSGSWSFRESFSERYEKSTYPVLINSRSGFLIDGSVAEVDCAIIALHGDYGEDGRIQGALDTAHINYVGCGVSQGAVCSDKIYTKILAEHLGIPTAEWIYADSEDDTDSIIERSESALGYPVFVKPPTLGSSVGIVKAHCRGELCSAINKVKGLSSRILIEKAIDVFCEIECGFFQSSSRTSVSASGQINTLGAFYTYDKKYNLNEDCTTSHGVVLPRELKAKIEDFASRLAMLLQLRHISRIDFFVTNRKEIIFNEINTFPGMTNTSLYPLITEDMGYKRGEFINILLAEAVI